MGTRNHRNNFEGCASRTGEFIVNYQNTPAGKIIIMNLCR